jgi:hypothetical protein
MHFSCGLVVGCGMLFRVKLLSLDLYLSHVGMDSTMTMTPIEMYTWWNGSRERMALRWVGIACE